MKSPFRLSVLVFLVIGVVGSCVLPGHVANAAPARNSLVPVPEIVMIPGPLRSFERMAGISQQISPNDLLPMLARKVYREGYQQQNQTEFLILVERYLQQARELQILSEPSGKIQVKGCNDAGLLIRVLGYRMRGTCGQKGFALETSNPSRAFLTIDSGFPLVELEEALGNGTPFTYNYPSSPVPVLFHSSDWAAMRTGKRRTSGEVVDVLINEPQLARLYWALASEDTETRETLVHTAGLRALVPYAPVLDFYGGELRVRGGHVDVPGGAAADAAWRELVGVAPDSPGKFITALISKDKGWMAAYFDALARVSTEQQKQLTKSPRLKRMYIAFRDADSETGATTGVFRKNAELLVLFTRLDWDADGNPHVPGDLDVWRTALHQKSSLKQLKEIAKHAQSWKQPEQLLDGMAELAQVETDIGPLQMYLSTTEIDRSRGPGRQLSPDAVKLMISRYPQYGTWFEAFSEFPELSDDCIKQFIAMADSIGGISNRALRANTEGSFQATLGLWQILARQGEIPRDQMSASWIKVMEPFGKVFSSSQLFDASRTSVRALLAATGSKPEGSQAELVDLLAGPKEDGNEAARVHTEILQRMNSVLQDQRLVALDTLFALNDGLKQMESGGKADNLLPLAEELHGFDLPQPIFTQSEKISWAPAIYTDHHAELQVKTDLTKVIKGPSTKSQLENARGQLAPFLRDTLVGLNYAYYEPPDAQMLHHNPLFVRSHDFLGISIIGSERLWGAPQVLGVGTPAGGGAYLMGSLSDLSYALALTEEDFIAPRNIQALIVKELAPVLMMSATLPRWWTVTPNELHAVTLYQRSGEELLQAAASDQATREKVLNILSDRVEPQRLDMIEGALQGPEDAKAMIPQMTPAETAYLAEQYQKRYPNEAQTWGPASKQLQDLRSRDGQEVSWDRISRDFGVPHPTLAQTNACELVNVKPFPFYGSYSSRLYGESWESSNLYWARLADEAGYSPVDLNSLVPELTRRMISNIYATDLDDWPAVLRALHQTGDEFRQGKIAVLPAINNNSHASTQVPGSMTVQ